MIQRGSTQGQSIVWAISCQVWGRLFRGVMGIGFGLTMGLGWHNCQPTIALDAQALLLLTQPLTPAEINLLEQGIVPADPSWVTANTISQTDLTTPSLWWAKQQFGGRLLTNWLAKPGTEDIPNRVDLLVNQQVWTSYNYLDRYAFLNQIGRVAQDFGYSTRAFNAQGELLGAYICDFDRTVPLASSDTPEGASNVPFIESNRSTRTDSTCRIFLDPSGVGAVRGAGATGAL